MSQRKLLPAMHQGRLIRRVAAPRVFGPPALAAIGVSALGASILYILGVVSNHALGLTPLVFLASSGFFVLTVMTYVEGNTVHPEQGGASTFARYAFDELWSFVAGWAILLDYLIVMAIALLAIPSYLAAFWAPLADAPARLVVAGASVALVVTLNLRGVSARDVGRILRLAVVFLALAVVIVVAGLITQLHPDRAIDSVRLGSHPALRDLLYAAVLAGIASTGIESASGLAPEIRVGRRDLRRLLFFCVLAVLLILVGLSSVATLAAPLGLHGGAVAAPLLAVVSHFGGAGLHEPLRYAVAIVGALVLLGSLNGTMLGISRVSYSLATNRQIPSLLGRLSGRRATPFVTITLAGVISFALAAWTDVDLLAGIFAFGAMIVFTIAHASVIVLRFREPQGARPVRIPVSIPVGRATVPVPALVGALLSAAGWLSVVILHAGARYVGGVWMLAGVVLYVAYRRSQGKSLRARVTIHERALQELPETDFGSLLVPVFGGPLDDDIVATAGRLAAEHGEEGEGGAVIEALAIVEVPMSLPLDARLPEEKVARARQATLRAKAVGEEYEGVVVATAMVRARSVGAAIVAEAKRRGVEAIVLAADDPAPIGGGARLGGRGGPRERSVGAMTRYVVEKAPCRVILTAAPAPLRRRNGDSADSDGAGRPERAADPAAGA